MGILKANLLTLQSYSALYYATEWWNTTQKIDS